MSPPVLSPEQFQTLTFLVARVTAPTIDREARRGRAAGSDRRQAWPPAAKMVPMQSRGLAAGTRTRRA
jgi:hypothetical protein